MKKVMYIEKEVAPIKTKLRVCAYCRVSTEKAGQKNSFKAQKEYYENLILENASWIFVDIYADYGKSGTSIHKRTEFKRLINDAKNGKVDLIITKSISRFARNTLDAISIVRDLKNIGVGVIFEKENINTLSEKSELMLTIISSIAEDESISISKNIKWSVKKRFESGTFIIATPPFGYKLSVNKNIEIIEDEAEYVRLIFKKYIEFKSLTKLSKFLEFEKITTRNNKNWSISSISRLIKNPIYIGDLLYQKRYNEDTPPFKTIENRGEKQKFYVENNHKKIIDKEIFISANEILDANRTKYFKT